MLWHKSWLETRWRFFIGLGLLFCSSLATVFMYPEVVKLLPAAHVPNLGGELGRQIRESIALAQSFPGYVWGNWFRQNQSQMVTLFAILLGTAGVLSPASGALFTLSLPVSRQRLLAVRAGLGLGELFLLAILPALVIPLTAPSIGQSFSLGSALVHGLSMFVAATVFFALAFLLSTMFADVWRPLLIAIAAAMLLALFDRVWRVPAFNLYRVMSAESWFRHGEVPWIGLLVCGAVAAGLYYAAVANLARRDF